MSLAFWIGLWKAVLVIGVGLFGVLAVVVTIGGAMDVIRLLRTLKQDHIRSQATASPRTPDE